MMRQNESFGNMGMNHRKITAKAFSLCRCGMFVLFFLQHVLASVAVAETKPDPRNILNGLPILKTGYCDQPYVVITKDGNWLCTLTVSNAHEGDADSGVVSMISKDQGKTWSEPIPLEPGEARENVYSLPLVTPSGRVYVFYDFNGDNFRAPQRSDSLGWFVFRYSDDNGCTWSKKRYRLPMPMAPVDYNNTFDGKVQLFWGIDSPIITGSSAMFAFTRCGKYVIDRGEGWFFRSDNILTENDPEKIRWQLLPDGEVGLKNPDFGEIQEEHNIVALSNGDIYCMYRTVNDHPCHAYSRDGGHTWTMPEYATYTPGGRKLKTPRACPKIWRTSNGKFLFWYHAHGIRKGDNHFMGRSPAWLCGGVERNGFIHWSQPEIVLYDPSQKNSQFFPETCEPISGPGMSYPDLIEQNGRYWITETQKTAARVHEIDPTLLEGLWSQGELKKVTRQGLVLDLESNGIKAGSSVPMPKLPSLDSGGGFAIDFWVKLNTLSPGQVLLDSRDKAGRGIVVTTDQDGAIRIELNDGHHKGFWSCDPNTINVNQQHHVVVIVDGGPNIISYVIDGKFHNGGEFRPYGWGRFSSKLGDVNSSSDLRIVPSLDGVLKRLRIYDRFLRTSEAIANYHADKLLKP